MKFSSQDNLEKKTLNSNLFTESKLVYCRSRTLSSVRQNMLICLLVTPKNSPTFISFNEKRNKAIKL